MVGGLKATGTIGDRNANGSQPDLTHEGPCSTSSITF